MDERFEFGLDCLLDGIRLVDQLGRQAATSTAMSLLLRAEPSPADT